jgi:putative ABC transport system permease protein
MLLKQRGFTAAAVVTLALGIGANAAMFSAVNAVVLRPLSYSEPERLVLIRDVQGEDETPNSYPEFMDWREQSSVLESVGAYFNTSYNLTGGGDAEQVFAGRASSNLFPMLGLTPVIGRSFLPEEEVRNGPQVAMISYALWQRRFGGSESALGSTLTLDGRAFSIVGVLPPHFRAVRPEDEQSNQPREIWLPLRLDETRAPRGFHFLAVIGRLRPGVTLDDARRDMQVTAEQLKQARSTAHGIQAYGLQETIVRDSRKGLLLLLAAVGLVLLIGCANVANLLLARATARQKEIAIRQAVGASRARLVRQLLTESMVLALVGGGLGVLVAVWLMSLLADSARDQLPRIQAIGLDARVLAFTAAVSLLTGLLFGLWPAIRAMKSSTFEVLKEGGRSAAASFGRDRARSFLVVSEVALSLVVLIAAGLVVNSFVRLLLVPKGFDPHGVLTFEINPSSLKYPEGRQLAQFYEQVLERIARQPGVDSCGAVTELPLGGGKTYGGTGIEGRTYPQGEEPVADKRVASEGYFETMRIPLVAGRYFEPRDGENALKVAIVNEEFARRYFPGENAIGKRIDFMWETTGLQEIVGIVGNVRHDGLETPPDPEVYVPYRQRAPGAWSVAVRTSGDPFAVAGAIREQVRAVDPDEPVSSLRSMDDVVSSSVSARRLSLFLYGGLAGLALILSVVGIYGVMSYSVAQRAHEIGIRMALGARRADVLRLITGQALKLTLAGTGIGVAGALIFTRWLESQLFEVKPADAVTFSVIALMLIGVALIASYIPARRASRADPMMALREE